MVELTITEELVVTVTCDHRPNHTASFAGGLPAPAAVSAALKVHGCRYNSEALEGAEVFAPPPPAVEIAAQDETNTATFEVEAQAFTEVSGNEGAA